VSISESNVDRSVRLFTGPAGVDAVSQEGRGEVGSEANEATPQDRQHETETVEKTEDEEAVRQDPSEDVERTAEGNVEGGMEDGEEEPEEERKAAMG